MISNVTYLNLGLREIAICNPIIIADGQLVLVDNKTNVAVEVGQCDDRQDKGDHKDDYSVDGAAEVGLRKEKATPVLGALDERLVAVHDGPYSGRKEHGGGNEDGQ